MPRRVRSVSTHVQHVYWIMKNESPRAYFLLSRTFKNSIKHTPTPYLSRPQPPGKHPQATCDVCQFVKDNSSKMYYQERYHNPPSTHPSPPHPKRTRSDISMLHVTEGSLEVKFPTIWTDEKQSRAEAERK